MNQRNITSSFTKSEKIRRSPSRGHRNSDASVAERARFWPVEIFATGRRGKLRPGDSGHEAHNEVLRQLWRNGMFAGDQLVARLLLFLN